MEHKTKNRLTKIMIAPVLFATAAVATGVYFIVKKNKNTNTNNNNNNNNSNDAIIKSLREEKINLEKENSRLSNKIQLLNASLIRIERANQELRAKQNSTLDEAIKFFNEELLKLSKIEVRARVIKDVSNEQDEEVNKTFYLLDFDKVTKEFKKANLNLEKDPQIPKIEEFDKYKEIMGDSINSVQNKINFIVEKSNVALKLMKETAKEYLLDYFKKSMELKVYSDFLNTEAFKKNIDEIKKDGRSIYDGDWNTLPVAKKLNIIKEALSLGKNEKKELETKIMELERQIEDYSKELDQVNKKLDEILNLFG